MLFPLAEFCVLELVFLCVAFFRSRGSLLCSKFVTHFLFKLIVEFDGLLVVVLRFHNDVVEVFVDNVRAFEISGSYSLSESIPFELFSDDVDW